MTSPKAFNAAMEESGLRPVDLASLVGVTRCTIWRWQCGNSPVPHYAWTIVRLQQRVRELTAAQC